MAIATKSSGVAGKWHDKSVLKSGDLAKIKTEPTEQPSPKGGNQWVCKLHVKGQPEPLNFAINKPSKNALIDAFGEETKNWIDKLLTLHVETAIINGKKSKAVYLLPEDFEVTEDDGGYIVIVKKGAATMPPPPRSAGGRDYPEEDIDPDDIPF